MYSSFVVFMTDISGVWGHWTVSLGLGTLTVACTGKHFSVIKKKLKKNISGVLAFVLMQTIYFIFVCAFVEWSLNV